MIRFLQSNKSSSDTCSVKIHPSAPDRMSATVSRSAHRRPRGRSALLPLPLVATILVTALPAAVAFAPPLSHLYRRRTSFVWRRMSEEWKNDPGGTDSNQWRSIDDEYSQQQEDWQDVIARKNDGSFWTDFEPTDEETMNDLAGQLESEDDGEDTTVDDAEAWLSTLASISADEVEFNMVEASRADKARQMEEWGFDSETIKNTFAIAVDDKLEKEEVEGMKAFRDASYWDDDDWKTVESHSKVEKDPETEEPFRQQMVGIRCYYGKLEK